MSTANPHWRHIQQQPLSLTIFHGPHSYVSASNYTTQENVPTWNYGAVHVYGSGRVFSDMQDILSVLHDLIPTFEAAYQQQWESLSESYRQRMLSHIVGFEISVMKIEAKFKLSQNRTPEEQQNVIDSLCPAHDTAVSGTGRLMRELGLGTKKEEK